jgi:hypothetical protein
LLASSEWALGSAEVALHSAQNLKVFSALEVRDLERQLRGERSWLAQLRRSRDP